MKAGGPSGRYHPPWLFSVHTKTGSHSASSRSGGFDSLCEVVSWWSTAPLVRRLMSVHGLNASDGNVSCLSATAHGEAHGAGVTELHHDFNLVVLLILSFASIWCAGKAASKLGLPTLVGEILVGVVLGPPVANLMPVPEALMLFGELGLMLLVLEAGLDVDLDMLKLIGLRGVAIALTGSLLPLGLHSMVIW